jgi:hypothetical protein
MSGANVSVEIYGVKETQSAMAKVGVGITPQGAPMRSATIAAVDVLARALGEAAHGSPTPQAALVAATISKGPDVVMMGGGTPVGHRHTPARELVAGSEHGGRHFQAPHSAGGYWISPTVEKEKQGATREAIQAGVDAAITEAGF